MFFLFRISLEADSVSQFNVNGMMGISKRPSRSPSNSCPQSPVRAQKRKIDDREPCEIIPNPSEPVELHPNKRQAVEEVEGMKGTQSLIFSIIFLIWLKYQIKSLGTVCRYCTFFLILQCLACLSICENLSSPGNMKV